MAKDRFELREPILNLDLLKKYIDLKLIISKIVSITLIVTTLLLSHINVAFWSILVWLNLSEILYKCVFMLILAEKPNSRKKPNNMGRKELVNWEENH